jgi:hypothetical protein
MITAVRIGAHWIGNQEPDHPDSVITTACIRIFENLCTPTASPSAVRGPTANIARDSQRSQGAPLLRQPLCRSPVGCLTRLQADRTILAGLKEPADTPQRCCGTTAGPIPDGGPSSGSYPRRGASEVQRRRARFRLAAPRPDELWAEFHTSPELSAPLSRGSVHQIAVTG